MSRQRKRSRRYSYSGSSGKRRRALVVPHPINIQCGRNFVTFNGGRSWTETAPSVYKPVNSGRPYSSGFGLGDETHPGPPYHTGGPFIKFTFDDPLSVTSTGSYTAWQSANIGYRYDGGFVPISKFSDFNSFFSSSALADECRKGTSEISSLGNIDSYGATGWNRFRPGNPTADLGVFLGELRDVPRMLSGTAKFFHNLWRSMGGSLTAFAPKNVADVWLNTQFGWRPFISDLRKFYRTYSKLDEHLNRIRRDNGKWKRRGGTVQIDSDAVVISSSTTATGHWPPLSGYHYQSGVTGNRTLSLVTKRKVWFEGAFRYWIPDVNSVSWERRAIAELYGVMPCPSLVWNLIPWSWLVDWCSNVGDVISNMSTGYADNLAAKYAYIMGTTTKTGELHSVHAIKGSPLHNTWSFPIEWKTRSAASPFGFGLSGDDFTARQLSILAALGISRLK